VPDNFTSAHHKRRNMNAVDCAQMQVMLRCLVRHSFLLSQPRQSPPDISCGAEMAPFADCSVSFISHAECLGVKLSEL
jgi:hypothetical protein